MRSRSRWGVPTTDGWGELLFEPDWSRRRPLEDWDHLLLFVPVPVLAVAMVYEFDWFLVAVTLFIAGFAAFTAWIELVSMPFRVYKGGFTETYVPLRRGLMRRETVVPASRLDKVTVTKEETRGIDVYTVRLQYRSPEGEDRALALDHSDIDDPMAMLLALGAAAPAAMDPTTDPFVGPGALDAVYTVPEDHWRRRKRGSLNMGGFIFLCIAASIAALAAPEDVMTSGVWEAIIVVTAVTSLFLGFASYALARDYGEHFQVRAKVEGDALTTVAMPGHKLLARCRTRVPLSEVARARKSLDKVSFFHKARLDMVSGETLELPHEVFEALEAHPAFRRDGFDLVNAGEVAARGRAVARVSPVKALLVLLVLLYVLNRI